MRGSLLSMVRVAAPALWFAWLVFAPLTPTVVESCSPAGSRGGERSMILSTRTRDLIRLGFEE
jgi:hypothetical protein